MNHRLETYRHGRARTRNPERTKEKKRKEKEGFVGYLPFSTLISGPSPLRSLSLEHRIRPVFVRQLPRPTTCRQRPPSALQPILVITTASSGSNLLAFTYFTRFSRDPNDRRIRSPITSQLDPEYYSSLRILHIVYVPDLRQHPVAQLAINSQALFAYLEKTRSCSVLPPFNTAFVIHDVAWYLAIQRPTFQV